MSDADGAEGPKTVDFLDLSLEVRDQIYRELLFQPIGYGAARRRHKFETSILRVNKQIHQEASRVLYEENVWVVFEMHSIGKVDRCVVSHDYLTYISRQVSAGRLHFGGIPSLRVRMQDDRSRRYKYKHIEYVIIPLEWVRDMTKVFVRNNIRNWSWELGSAEFTIHLRETQKHESRRRMAMEFLECIRGVRKAKIHGLPSPLNFSFAKHMRTPLNPIDEVIDLASMYIRHAKLVRAQGQFGHAEELYEQAYNCSIWATWRAFIAEANPTKSKIFKDQLYESLAGSAFCSSKNGGSERACNRLKEYIKKNSELSDVQQATGFYYYGLASVAAGFGNRALWGFMRALVLVPGYEGVDKEVDAIEDRVGEGGYGDCYDRLRISRNLEQMRPHRHQNAGNGELTQEQKNKVIREFEFSLWA